MRKMGNNLTYKDEKNSVLIVFVLLGDLIILNLLYHFYESLWGNSPVGSTQVQTMLVMSMCYLLCTVQNGVVLYRRKVSNYKIVLRALNNVAYYAILSYILLVAGCFSKMPLTGMLVYWASFAVCSILFRLLVRCAVKLYRSGERHMRKVVFVGSFDNMVALYREMVSSSSMGYKVLGYFDDSPNDRFPQECRYLGRPADVIGYLNEHENVDDVFCCLPSARHNEITPIINYCLSHVVHFFSVPNLSNYLHRRVFLNTFGKVPYLSLYREPLTRASNRMLKRLFDFSLSLLFLCTLFPILFVVVAIITKLTMPGPIFFKQKRSGFNGKEFYCYKFRSMKVNDQADTLQATKDDPRKTRWGNIMRKTNIDEFPQFINVLLGQMSIVGPRPHMVKQTEDYSKLIGNYMVRHYMKPGITGWSQVTGFRGETRELSQMEGRVEHDIWYMEHWSLMLDLYIVYKTFANIFIGDKNAY